MQAFDARTQLSDVVRQTFGIAELLASAEVLQTAERFLDRNLQFAKAPTQTVLPRFTFEEALEDLVSRTPKTVRRASERTAQRIAELYGASEGRIIAFTRSAEAAVTKRAQEFLAQAFREGLTENEAGRGLVESIDEVRKRTRKWSEGYARMVFRTNVNSAATAGRFRQMQDPDIRAVIPAAAFTAVGDGDTRDNHDAADGLIFKVDNPIWNQIAPPLGYNCRCGVRMMSIPILASMGRLTANGEVVESRLPPDAFPDDGFRHVGRPDLFGVPS